MKPRLAIYIRSIKTARGAERVSTNVALGLADLGYAVDFLVEDDSGHLIERLRNHSNIRVINLRDSKAASFANISYMVMAAFRGIINRRQPSLKRAGLRTEQIFRFLRKKRPPVHALCHYIDTAKPTAVLAYLNLPSLSLLLAAILRPAATRYLVSVRHHISTGAEHSTSTWQRSVPPLMRWLFPHADLVISPSQGVAEDMLAITQLPAERSAVVYNPVYRSEILQLSKLDPGHPWLMDGPEPVVLAAGKLEPQKDFQTLLLAFSIVVRNRPARLIMLGEGHDRELLENMIRDLDITQYVEMPGFVENPHQYFKRANLFVLSSAWEGLPNVLIEAMACGCPAVATDCPSGPREILDEGRIGKLVPVGNAEALAKAIIESLDNPPERSAFVQRAKIYSFENAIAGYESVLTGLSSPGTA